MKKVTPGDLSFDDYNDDCSHLRGGPFDGELRTRLRCVSVLADKTSQTKVGHLVIIVIMITDIAMVYNRDDYMTT